MALLNSKEIKEGIESSAFLDENKKVKKVSSENIKKQRVKPSFAAIAPAVDITNNDFIEMASGEYLEILSIMSKDIYSLNADDLYHDIDNIANFLISYNDDLKFIPLNVPIQLEEQKRYFLKKLKQTKNPLHYQILEKRIKEFEFLEKNTTNREYFLFIYNKDEMKLKQKVSQIKNILSRSNPLSTLSVEKKISILFQLSNPTTKPIID